MDLGAGRKAVLCEGSKEAIDFQFGQGADEDVRLCCGEIVPGGEPGCDADGLKAIAFAGGDVIGMVADQGYARILGSKPLPAGLLGSGGG